MWNPLSLACVASLVLVAGCDKSNSVGDVKDSAADEGNDDGPVGSTDDGATGPDVDAGEAGTDAGEAGTDGGDPPNTCAPGQVFAIPPACGVGVAPAIIEPGCFDECSDGQPCGAGTTCMAMQYNPCPCPPDAEACCGACGAEQEMCIPDTYDTLCGSIIGRTFVSIEQLECGISPEGENLCNWTVAFDNAGEVLWMHSDVGEGAPYTCQDGVLTTQIQVDFSFDPATLILTWDGVEYEPMPV